MRWYLKQSTLPNSHTTYIDCLDSQVALIFYVFHYAILQPPASDSGAPDLLRGKSLGVCDEKGFFLRVLSFYSVSMIPAASVSRPALRPTQPRIQSILGVKRGRGVTLTTHLHLVQMSRMSRNYTSSPLVACMTLAGQLFIVWEQTVDPSATAVP
jgi:hypothetical protein